MSRRSAPKRPQRSPLSRERVLGAALELADERGIDSLTMRELGQRLGVEAMSLYNHVSGKDEILDGIVDLVVGEIDLPAEDVGWAEAMRRRAISAKQVFARHPWASTLIDTRTSSGPERLRYLDWVIGTLRRAGFSVEVTLHAFSTIDAYVYGSVRQQFAGPVGEADQREGAEALLAEIPPDQYPHLSGVIAHFLQQGGNDDTADFEFGLDLILDGLGRLLA